MARTPGGQAMGLKGLGNAKGVQSMGKTRGLGRGGAKAVTNFGAAMGQVAMGAARMKQRNMSAGNKAAYGTPGLKQVKTGNKTMARIVSRGKRTGTVVLGKNG